MAVAKEGWLYIRIGEKWAKHYFVVLGAGPSTDNGLLCQFESPHARVLDHSWKIISRCTVKKKRSETVAPLPDGAGQPVQFRMDLPSTADPSKLERIVLASTSRPERDVWIGTLASVINDCPSSPRDITSNTDRDAKDTAYEEELKGKHPTDEQSRKSQGSGNSSNQDKPAGTPSPSRRRPKDERSKRRTPRDQNGKDRSKSGRSKPSGSGAGHSHQRPQRRHGSHEKSRRPPGRSKHRGGAGVEEAPHTHAAAAVEDAIHNDARAAARGDSGSSNLSHPPILDSFEDPSVAMTIIGSDMPEIEHDPSKVRCVLCGISIDIDHVDSHSQVCSHDLALKATAEKGGKMSQIDASVQDHIYTGDVGQRLRSLERFLSRTEHPKTVKLIEVVLRLAWLREYVTDWDSRTGGKLTQDKAVLRKHYQDAINKMASELEAFAALYQPSNSTAAATNGAVA